MVPGRAFGGLCDFLAFEGVNKCRVPIVAVVERMANQNILAFCCVPSFGSSQKFFLLYDEAVIKPQLAVFT